MRTNTKVDLSYYSKKKNYLCQVTIFEARELKTDNAKVNPNPFIKIQVANESPQVTNFLVDSSQGKWN